MTNLFSDVVSTEVVEQEQDKGSFFWDTNVYKVKILQAFVRPSAGGSLGLTLNLEDDKKRKYRETIYFTNKSRQTFYEKNGEKSSLPGFLQANTLAAIIGEAPIITQMTLEERVVNLYNVEAKAEIPTKVQMLVEMLGKEINVAIQRISTNKTTKVGDKYVPTNERKEENKIVKFFTGGDLRLTASELAAKATEEDYVLTWEKNNKGKLIDKFKEQANSPAASGGDSTPPTDSLFN